jgi:hypothetical protein
MGVENDEKGLVGVENDEKGLRYWKRIEKNWKKLLDIEEC